VARPPLVYSSAETKDWFAPRDTSDRPGGESRADELSNKNGMQKQTKYEEERAKTGKTNERKRAKMSKTCLSSFRGRRLLCYALT